MFSYKRLVVKHNQRIDACREQLEQVFKTRFNAKECIITDGKVVIKYYPNEYLEVPIVKAISALIYRREYLPSNYREVAELWILSGISLKQVEELLNCSIIYLPKQFFEYAFSVEKDYFEYLEYRMTEE